jgi:hypothetical protein
MNRSTIKIFNESSGTARAVWFRIRPVNAPGGLRRTATYKRAFLTTNNDIDPDRVEDNNP